MSFPKYYATYCVSDGDAGANPFWHASLILSKQETEEGPIKVEDAVGFYSQPSTTTNPLHKMFKYILGFKVDLQDGHGILKKEEMRHLDGNGLHGITFSASAEQFECLKTLYRKEMDLEKEAIQELNESLLAAGMAANGHTRFITEKASAAEKKRDPRLYPFHFTIKFSKKGIDSSASVTCKTHALNLLREASIIDQATYDKISGGQALRAFPRFSQNLLPLRLVSTGTPKVHVSRRDKIYYNREWERNTLMWATVPFLYGVDLPKADLSTSLFQYQCIKNILTRTRKTERLLIDKLNELKATPDHQTRRGCLKEQVERVQKLYNKFSLATENQLPNCLNEKLWVAEATLNVAELSLTPERVNYPFILRAYESLAARNALLSMIAMVALAGFVSHFACAVLMTTATLAAGHQLYQFFKQECQFAQARADYTAFIEQKKKPSSIATPSALEHDDERGELSLSPMMA